MLVDTHAHLDDERFDADRDAVVERAIDAGVAFIINPGVDLETSRLAVGLAEKHECVYAAVGVHPHEAEGLNREVCEELRALAAHEKVVAVGEIGLDYYRDLSPREVQRDAFRRQLTLASELELPVIVHSRDAHEDVEKVLKEVASSAGSLENDKCWDVPLFPLPSGEGQGEGKSIGRRPSPQPSPGGRGGHGPAPFRKLRGVLHCFSGGIDWAKRAVKIGLLIGLDGPLTYKNASKLRAVAESVPLEQTLVETDCPYLAPAPHKRSERNEPAFVRLVAEKLAQIRKLATADVCRVTGLAASRLFGIPSADEHARIAYVIRNSLYLNITNRCSNRCTFCIRQKSEYVKGHRLWLEHEPTVEEIEAAAGDIGSYDEVVFCGYGEPTERLRVLKEVARRVKVQGKRVRIVTNGEGDLINGRPIAAELAGLVDKLSVSVNTADADQHVELCRSTFGRDAHPAILKFIEGAKGHIGEIEITAVGAPGVDMKAVERLAEKMGVTFRPRQYNDVG